MSKILSPTPVLAGVLESCRDWRQWLVGLDAIPEVNGITDLVTSNCHWLAFCRRKDLPIDIAAQYGDLTEQGLVSAHGDIMCLVKEFMSDSALSQKPCCLIRSGSSNLLPDPGGPQHWEPRKEFERDEKKDLQRLCGKIRKVLPSAVLLRLILRSGCRSQAHHVNRLRHCACCHIDVPKPRPVSGQRWQTRCRITMQARTSWEYLLCGGGDRDRGQILTCLCRHGCRSGSLKAYQWKMQSKSGTGGSWPHVRRRTEGNIISSL